MVTVDIKRWIFAIISGIFVSIMSGTFLITLIPNAYNQEYIWSLILGTGLLSTFITFVNTLLRFAFCLFTGLGMMVLGGFAIYFFADFVSSYSNPNISSLSLIGIRWAIMFFSFVVAGIAVLLGWILIELASDDLL
jgi:hypothetical protein